MKKLLTRIIGAATAFAMAIGVGFAVANNKHAYPVSASLSDEIGDKVTNSNFESGRLVAIRKNTNNEYVTGIDSNWIRTGTNSNDWIEFTISGTASSFTLTNDPSGAIYMSANNKAAFSTTQSTNFSTDSNGYIYFSETQFLQYNGSGFRAYASNDNYANAYMYYIGTGGGGETPEPTQLSAPANLSASGPILSWTNVENNNGYSYSINTTPEATTGNIAKNATSFNTDSLPLTPGTYSFRLMAKGNGESYLDSNYCEAVSFTAPEYTVDTFTVSDFAATNNQYTLFSITGSSGSEYVGYSAKNGENIQFNNYSSPKNRSIATSVSCGYIRKVSVAWGNDNSKEFTVYAGDTAYTSSSAATGGTAQTAKLSATNTIVAIFGNNRYVSLYPNGAIYPASVSFYWEPVLENQTITASAESVREDQTITVSTDATGEVTWNIVSGAGTTAPGATVTSAGVVSVTGPGTVTVKASVSGYHDATKQLTFTEKPAGTYYTITFDEDGGSNSPDNESILSGQTFVFPSAGTKEHYTFLGWTTDGNDFYAEGETSPVVTGNANYLAWWEEDAKYTVTYSAGSNGSGSYVHNNNYAGSYELLPFANLTGINADDGYRFKNYTVGGINKNVGDTINLGSVLTVVVNFELIPPTDVLTANYIGQGSYGDWSEKNGTSTDAVYAGNSSTSGNNAIQIRTSNSNSGIVSTVSGGKIRKVVVQWDTTEANNDGKTIDIYAKNTPYSAATELYSGSTQGTKIGSISYTNSTNYQTELTISGNYRYVGIRSNKNAIYLDEIDLEWEPLTAQEKVEDLVTNTQLSYHYSKNEDVYSYSNISIRFGGLLTKALWDELDTNEHVISGFGVMITTDNVIGESEYIKDFAEAAEPAASNPNLNSNIANHYMPKSSMATPPEDGSGNNYLWNLFFTIEDTVNGLNDVYVAAAYIKVGDNYVFFKQVRYSVKTLAQDYLDHRDCDDSTAEGSLANLAA